MSESEEEPAEDEPAETSPPKAALPTTGNPQHRFIICTSSTVAKFGQTCITSSDLRKLQLILDLTVNGGFDT